MPARTYRIAVLLFLSGYCALIYQIVWLRELRLIFGSSTPATAAVLAVFMGGLGLGSWLLSKRVDRVARPLSFYAKLEFGIAITAAISTFLLAGAREVYIAMGGSVSMGDVGGTVSRLLLAALVLLPTTFMMGGTLPAAARASTARDDTSRRGVALLYGVNTLGAVTGAAVATFILLEVFGTRVTLWLGCLINVLVAIAARAYDRALQAEEERATESPVTEPSLATRADSSARDVRAEHERVRSLIVPFVLGAAAATGFAFILMELVWYRMLAPLLGGSSYTFGLILAVALAGIGLGGLAYSFRGRSTHVLLSGFALTCALEALLLALPFALGDRVALLALFLRDMGSVGLFGSLIAWTVVTCIVTFPAAIVAGYQFPLLIALLGQEKQAVGRHVGLAYAFNTLGSIFGSLAGGFLLIPTLSALGSWRLAVWVLVLLGIAAMALHSRGRRDFARVLPPALLSVAALAAIYAAVGPTAAWRHLPIGAGRVDAIVHDATRNSIKKRFNQRRRAISWEADGRESSVALHTLDGTAFLVSGKSDGSAQKDAGTQVMGGMLGALLNKKKIRRAMVVGLGTGSTAGWLASLPNVERVDVVELEPAILEVARICSPVNRAVLENPKINIIIGDAREVLLTTPERYDLIFSEPSNPYRAGIASLFTQEFYEAVSSRLNEGGVFAQWLQAYEIDAQSVRIVYATTSSVFPSVESWRTQPDDLLLLCRQQDQPIDLTMLHQRIQEPGFKEALMNAWRVQTPAGVVGRFVARPSLARAVAQEAGMDAINIDDRNLLEFSVSRSLGRPSGFDIERLRSVAEERGEALPEFSGSESLGPHDVVDAIVSLGVVAHDFPLKPTALASNPGAKRRALARAAWVQQRPDRAVKEWEQQDEPPTSALDWMVMADAYAAAGNADQAQPLIDQLSAVQPIEADAITAKLRWAQNKPAESWQALKRALIAYRTNPWPNRRLMQSTLPLVRHIARKSPALAAEVQEVLEHPFAVSLLDESRLLEWLDLALARRDGEGCAKALSTFEAYPVWSEDFLRRRLLCYALTNHPLLGRAEEDLEEFYDGQGGDIGAGLSRSSGQ